MTPRNPVKVFTPKRCYKDSKNSDPAKTVYGQIVYRLSPISDNDLYVKNKIKRYVSVSGIKCGSNTFIERYTAFCFIYSQSLMFDSQFRKSKVQSNMSPKKRS
jgi:hypothetical protein